ncbi:DUF6020 family protein [Collinsella sp. An2]|uniref:DUF6020 family protein n=1 Tax=Collinsella sp. An2 TaxID=1965585 RepID=UPI000B3AADC0|nr:DUF6020 family protein [Collinsella sp. An2]OUP09735.1 hypothetical protein B5F33_03875 [Collinsella sp. An2]
MNDNRRYPLSQTVAAFALALLCTAALSIDPTAVSYKDIVDIDPTATGALYICYEVLLSFAGHADAIVLLALAILLTFPVRHVFFGRRDSWRPSVVLPALFFAFCMVFGRSYDLTNSAQLAIGGISRTIESVIAGAGFALLAHTGIYLLFEGFDWLGGHRVPFTEARYGRVWGVLDWLLNRHPFALPLLVLVVCWAPTFIGSAPGIFMGDTGAQIRQWFNLPNGTSDYLNLIDPNVLLNGHHPVVHTALLGSCVQLGMAVFGDENMGVLLYTTLQFAVSALAIAYAVSSLKRLGVHLLVRAIALGFFACMPLFSNYAVLITKDVFFADAFLVLVIQTIKLLVPNGVLRSGAAASAAARRATPAGETAQRTVPAGETAQEAAPAGEASLPASIGEAALDASASAEGRQALEGGLSFRGLAAMTYSGEVVPFAAHDWVLLLLGAVGCTFLRNGGVVFPAAACVVVAACLLIDARRVRRLVPAPPSRRAVSGGDGAPFQRDVEPGAGDAPSQRGVEPGAGDAPSQHGVEPGAVGASSSRGLEHDRRASRKAMGTATHLRRAAIGAVAVLVVAVSLQLVFSNVVMPAFKITPGSRREMLSIPFQQTARFVQKHDGANAGIDGGTSDGLVTDEERAVIDTVLNYDTLASRYDPDKSDDVKNEFNEDTTSDELAAYFRVWLEMFFKDPACYVSAFANNYFGYFYPSTKDAWMYTTSSSAEVESREANRRYFNFHRMEGPVVAACDSAVNLYRTAVQRIPLLSLTMSSSAYVWVLLLVSVYVLRHRQWRTLGALVPLWGVLAMCLIGPCNGSTYMRYLYPIILTLPCVVAVALTGSRLLWRHDA